MDVTPDAADDKMQMAKTDQSEPKSDSDYDPSTVVVDENATEQNTQDAPGKVPGEGSTVEDKPAQVEGSTNLRLV